MLALAQGQSARLWHVRCRSNSGTPPHVAVAQRTERWSAIPEVARLIRAGDTISGPVAQPGERPPRKREAGGAKPLGSTDGSRRRSSTAERRFRSACTEVRLLSPAPTSRRHSSANRVSGFEPEGRRFESCWRRQRGCFRPSRCSACGRASRWYREGSRFDSDHRLHVLSHHEYASPGRARAGCCGLSARNRAAPGPDVVGYRHETGSRARRPQRSTRSVPLRQQFVLAPADFAWRKMHTVMRHDSKRAGSPGPAAVGYLVLVGSIPAPKARCQARP